MLCEYVYRPRPGFERKRLKTPDFKHPINPKPDRIPRENSRENSGDRRFNEDLLFNNNRVDVPTFLSKLLGQVVNTAEKQRSQKNAFLQTKSCFVTDKTYWYEINAKDSLTIY